MASAWEYKSTLLKELVQDGLDGWEAYAVTEGATTEPIFFLKRLRPPDPLDPAIFQTTISRGKFPHETDEEFEAARARGFLSEGK